MYAGGVAVSRRDASPALRDALRGGTLYQWAAGQTGREQFVGRGAVYGVTLGQQRVVVRHARRGGALAPLLQDRYLGSPRFLREIAMARHLASAGIPTPAVVAGVMYPTTFGHRADVATERVPGKDLAAIFFGDDPPAGQARREMLHAVGAMVRKLHDGGLIHPDLQLRNVLIADPSPSLPSPPHPSPTVWLLDVDTCRPAPKGDLEIRRWNLARFARSWEKFNRLKGPRLTDDDRTAFAAGYGTRT